MNSMSYGDQIDPRRRMPGSGMPPSSAPNIMTQVGRGTPFAGQAPQPMPRQQTQLIDPQVLKMLMEMLQRGQQRQAQGQGQAAGREQPLINQIGLASLLHEPSHAGLNDLSAPRNHGMLSGILGSGSSNSSRQGEAYGPYYPYYPQAPDPVGSPLVPRQFHEPVPPIPEIYDIAGPISWA